MSNITDIDPEIDEIAKNILAEIEKATFRDPDIRKLRKKNPPSIGHQLHKTGLRRS